MEEEVRGENTGKQNAEAPTREASSFRDFSRITLEDFLDVYKDEAYFLFVLSRMVPNPPESSGRLDVEAIFEGEETSELVRKQLANFMPRDDIVIQLYFSGLEGGFDRFGFDYLEEMFQVVASTDQSSIEEFADVAAEKWGLLVDYEGVEIYPSKSYTDVKELRELRLADCRTFIGLWQANVFNFATGGSAASKSP